MAISRQSSAIEWVSCLVLATQKPPEDGSFFATMNEIDCMLLYDVAKLTHPAVQVLPGEPLSKWRSVISEWIGHIPDYAGLKPGFKTDYAECIVHALREMWNDKL